MDTASARSRVVAALPVVIALAVFVAALEVLRLELSTVSWHDLSGDVLSIPLPHLLLALALTGSNYLVLAGYDLLAFRYVGRSVAVGRVVGVSMLAYAVAHSVGFAMLSGASVRYRFYSRWGVTAEELSRIVFSYSITFWLGLLALGGFALATTPLSRLGDWPGHEFAPAAGWVCMIIVAGFLALTVMRREPLRIRNWTLPLPSPGLAVTQLVISILDWSLAGAALYVLLPVTDLTVVSFIGAYLIAVLVGMISHVPGGVGVFESLMVLLLAPYATAGQLLPALVAYRAVYYLLPLSLAMVALVVNEVIERRHDVARAGAWLRAATKEMTPQVMAIFTFLAGSVLLWSGATPASPGRLSLVHRLFPLGVVEGSHFAGSVTGAALLILSQGLARRLDAAYYLASVLMVVGMVASLLKGFDYEEATLLLLVLVALRRAQPAFDRRAAIFETPFAMGWVAALAGSLAASIWLGFFAFKHVEYSNELWWRFELHGEASRFLRASVGAAILVILFGLTRLLRHAPHEVEPPTPADLRDAEAAIARQTATTPNLVFLCDKAVLFDERREGFVMYDVRGRTWVAMGDPVGSDEAIPGLVRAFVERCDDFGGVPAFYEIGPRHMHRYADFGFTFVKLGEEAMMNLTNMSLEGGRGKRYRQAMRRLERDGGKFKVVPVADVPALLPQLRAVSDDWLRHKSGSEKGFSLGFFDEEYLRRFPIAVVERNGAVVAFGNLWPGPGRVELSLDLMRYAEDAPPGVMEALLVHLAVWGKAEGYQRLALGMAPLSGFENSPVAPLWNRVGSFIYQHGSAVYGFQGLRAFKDKFDPAWEPRYLAYPGGLALPKILADTSALIAGGYRKLLLK